MKKLHDLLSIPTAPFREGFVIQWMISELKKNKVPFFQDEMGNIVVGFKSSLFYKKRLSKKSKSPLTLFIAHLDHPGFHGERWTSDNNLETIWHGGTPAQSIDGAEIWVSHPKSSEMIPGRILTHELHSHGKSIHKATVELEKPFQDCAAKDLFGAFRFQSSVWEEGDLLYTKAADDLIGAYSILETAIRLWKTKSPARLNFAGLLSRAEEVGFIGTLRHLEEFYKKPAKTSVVCVSLETSKTLPGAEIGKGPVVRLGDRTTIFHGAYSHLFSRLAQKLLPNAHQKRIMDGGSCEGTAATVYGLPTIAISVPLGNYHNQGENGPAPEFVSVNDIAGMQTLCYGLCTSKLNWNDPWSDQKEDFKKLLTRYKPLISKKENQKWVKSK